MLDVALNRCILPILPSCKTNKWSSACTSLQSFLHLPHPKSFIRPLTCNPGVFSVHTPNNPSMPGLPSSLSTKTNFQLQEHQQTLTTFIQAPQEPWNKPQIFVALRLPQRGWLQFFWTLQPTAPCPACTLRQRVKPPALKSRSPAQPGIPDAEWWFFCHILCNP